MKKKVSSLTLLEVVIALFLAGILLAFLFSFFKQALTTKTYAKALKEKIFSAELFQLRLNHLFASFREEGEELFLQTTSHVDARGECLLLRFNNGIDPDPFFARA